jgi:hypothetical protein
MCHLLHSSLHIAVAADDPLPFSAFHRPGAVIVITGLSGGADIEGVLVHPAQGVRSLTVIVDAERVSGAY